MAGVVFSRLSFANAGAARLTASYDIAVWTCNSRQYAIPIAKNLFGRHFASLEFIWCKEDCENGGAMLYKNLDKAVAATGRAARDIMLVDDTADKKSGSLGSGLIVISTFFPKRETLDSELLSLKSRIDLQCRS